ncbi:MAG: GNAT family N-acetyltransferase [Acidobacteria bacterium]|nr:GNAT family N-acetyltransferase [Acidobacteriota bacterium]
MSRRGSDEPRVPADRRAATALYRSLRDDPFYATIAASLGPGTAEFERALVRHFEIALDEAETSGRLVVDPDGRAAAAWVLPAPPDAARPARQAKEAALGEALGEAGLATYRRIVAFMGERARGQVPTDAWYLSIVGVAPEAQGRGLGRQVLEPTLAELDAAARSGYLETFSRRSESFYGRLGFETVSRHDEPATGAGYAIMRRRPRPASASTAPGPASTA